MAAVTSRGIPLSSVSPQYLHANSTSHTWPFSAIAELIDNAYDPDVSAKQLWIDKSVIKDQDCLIFMDNGNGMDCDEMHKMLSFGFSDKQTIRGHVPVGLYGNGFKSGSMRLGKDAIVFSKRDDTMCVGLLSQTYLEDTEAQNVIVPIVMFTNTGQTVSASPEHAESLHDILTHSLFNTKEELLSEFSVIDSSGTRIIIWNLRRTPSGELEFDFMKNRHDIRIPVDVYGRTGETNKRQAAGGVSVPESKYSLRAYCSILYLKPRMQIIIKGKKVKTQLVTKTLANVSKDTYKPDSVKKAIPIRFGYNTKSREHYGLMMYHNNRLIKAYERVACQRKADGRAVGVIGVIECNHLTPTHNKQDFDDTEDYRKILKNVGKKLEEYWKQQVYAPELKPNCTEDTVSCTDEEEPEDSDDEQPRNQKTYKQHERNQKLQQENRKQFSIVQYVSAWQRLSRHKSSYKKKPSSVLISSSHTGADTRPSVNTLLDTQLPSVPGRQKRALDSNQENPDNKKARSINSGHIPDNLPTSTVSAETFCSPAMFPPDSGANEAERKDVEKVKKQQSNEITQPTFEVEYLQAMQTVMQLQPMVENLKNEKCSLLTRCESLEKDLERVKRETEKAKVRVEDRGVQTDFHISSHEESASTSSRASNSGRRTDFGTQQHETQDRPKMGQETSNPQLLFAAPDQENVSWSP
ncbi:MORC family CW-type zinc finger protein 3-like [Ictalurus furcatus]|uniref:MORC family CW-type zinc finger protein 3-like n=1 Tax=Ictalurus furcatus TaxID=66913 RepID=UPI002350D333|nr:MORC family CW-type zinc finger protein 3-like [Ictalurus furcatus]XP_053483635.1 MORC family CW-type zinc finger protein 3-like [Ictalurus furcatus]